MPSYTVEVLVRKSTKIETHIPHPSLLECQNIQDAYVFALRSIKDIVERLETFFPQGLKVL